MTDTPADDPLAKRGRSLASLFTVIFWYGALWLFAEAYVPLKQASVAWLGSDLSLQQETGRALGQFAIRALPAVALLAAVRFARSLFTVFGTGAILVPENGERLGHIGTSLVAAAVLMLVGGWIGDGGHGGPLFSLVMVLGAVGLAIRWIGDAWARAAAAQAELEAFV
jgi:hypothetical protein